MMKLSRIVMIGLGLMLLAGIDMKAQVKKRGPALKSGKMIRIPDKPKGGGLTGDPTPIPMSNGHVDIFLRNYQGKALDIFRDTDPYSPRQTCGYCHDYDTVNHGYHFQQGAEFLDDDYGINHGTFPWVLSPGMTGKW